MMLLFTPLLAGGDYNIFELKGRISVWQVSLFLVVLLGITIVIEYFIHSLEHQFRHHIHYLKMIGKVYKELMILGFLGLTFLMVNQFHELSHDLIMVFEFAHVVIFLVAIFFVIHVIIFMLTLRRVKKRWDGTCGMHIDDISDKIIKEGKPDGSYWYRIALGEAELVKEAEFHIIKALFIDTFGLPRNFDFAKYMRRALSYHVTDLLDVKEYTWFFLIILVGLNYIRLRMTEVIYGGDASNSIVLSWIIGWVVLVAQLVMLFTVRHSKFKLLAKAGCHHTYDLVEVLNHLKEGAPRQASQEKRRNWQGNAPALDNKGDQSDNHYKGDSEDVDGGEIKFDHVTAENLHSGCSTDSKARGRCEDGGSDDASSNNKTGDARPHNLDTFTQESEVEVVPDRHHTTNNGDTSNAHKDANSRTSWHHQLKSTLYRSFAKTPARPLAPPWVRPASVATWSNTVLGHNQYVEGVDDDDVDDIDEELDFSNSDSDDDVSVRATKLNHDIQRRSHHRTRSSVLALPHESNVHLYRSRASSYDSSIFHTMQVPLTPEELREGVFPWDDSHLTTLCMEISLIVECFYMSLVIVYDTVPWYKEFSSFAATFFFVATVLPQLIGMFLVLPCLIQEHVFLASTAMANEAIIKEVAMVMADVCHLKTEASQVLQKEMFARQREALHQQQIKIRSSEAENSYGTPVHKPVIGFVPVNLISIIKEMYEEVDSEQKGYITPGQLRRVLARLHFKIDNRDFKRLIRAIDRNHTRQINYKEWESLILDQEVALDDEDFAQSLDSDLNEAVLSADNLSVGSRRLVSSGSTSAMNHLATHYSNPIRQGSSLPLDCISEEQLMLSEYATVANRGSADDEDIDGDQDNTYACESEMKMGKHPETLKTVMTREHGSRLSNEVVSLSNEQEAKERKAKSFTHNTNAVVPRDESRTKETRGNFVQEQLQLLRCFGEVLLRCEGCNRMVPMHRALAHTRHCSATKAADNGFFNHSHKINVRTARESLLDINNARTLHRI